MHMTSSKIVDFNGKSVLGTIIDSMPDFVFWKDRTGFIRGCSQGFAELCFGLSKDQVVGKSDFDLLPDHDHAALVHQEDLKVMSSATFQRSELWLNLPDGTRRCFDAQKTPLKKNGEVYGLLVVTRDITELKKLNDALLESETQYRSLFKNMSEGFSFHEIICDQQGVPCDYRFIEINEAFEQITGLSRSAVVGKTLLEIIPDEDKFWIEAFGRVALTGKPEKFNHYSPVFNKYFSVYAFSPALHKFAVLSLDSTERILGEQALKASEARLNSAQRIAKLGSWELNHTSGQVLWSQEIFNIHEIAPNTVASYQAFLEVVHPDDRALVESTFRAAIQRNSPYSITHRLLLPGNRIKYVHGQCETSFDAEGNPLYSIGTIHDITELKTIQDKLAKIVNNEREQHSFHNLVTNNSAMKNVLELAAQVAQARRTTVAIYGESGSGKEVLARAIHAASDVLPAAFIAVNCAAIPEQLLESELFGHERGSFTGADRNREGKFSAAQGGTILLDEIGDIPLSIQAKLLRVLEERTFEKVGGNIQLQADCRIVVATNRDLSKMVLEGRFREDLYHRVNIFPLYLPPLRERKEDIPLLCNWLLNSLQNHLGRKLMGISQQSQEILVNYHWPGNVRELRNCLERAAILCNDDIIRPEHLALGTIPRTAYPASTSDDTVTYSLSVSGSDLSIDSLHKQILDITLQRCNGNKSLAAKLLKIGRTSYYRAFSPSSSLTS